MNHYYLGPSFLHFITKFWLKMQSHNFVCLKIYSFGLLQKPYVKWPFSRNGYIVQILWQFFFYDSDLCSIEW